ncbi:MAG: cupredoxin domain-containing protein [Thermaerobacterales bacterium]
MMRIPGRPGMLVLVLISAMLAAACGGADGGAESAPPGAATGRTFDIAMSSGLQFNPDELRFDPGEMVTFRVENADSMAHTFTVDELDINVRVEPGATEEVTVTVSDAGWFTFYCAVPGHRSRGMLGRLVVGDAPAPPEDSEEQKEQEKNGETDDYVY